MSVNPETHNFDRRWTDVNVEALAVRVTGLEGRVESLERDLKDNTVELRANTTLTKQVHTNTETIVEAVKWISTTKKVAIAGIAGLGGLAGAAVAVQAAGKSFGWW